MPDTRELVALVATTSAAVWAAWQMHRTRRALVQERAARRLTAAVAAREAAAVRARLHEAAGRARAMRLVLAEADAVVDAELARLAAQQHNEESGDGS